MSILSTHDIEQSISIIEDGYARAIAEYGEDGRYIWPELSFALQSEGLRYYPTHCTVMPEPGRPMQLPHNNRDDYNLDEIAKLVNDRLADNGHNKQITLDWWVLHDGVWLELIGKACDFLDQPIKPREFHFYFNMANTRGGQMNWR